MIIKRDFRLYNIIFPFWILYFSPPFIIYAFLGNLIIDSIVILYTIRSKNIFITRKKLFLYILFAFIFGFIADFIGAFIIWLLSIKLNFISGFSLGDVKSFFVYILIIIFTGFLIYEFNYKYTRYIFVNNYHCRRIALRMGIITAPWLFLL